MKKKKLLIGLAIFLFIILSIGICYWQYTKSPKYSLLQAKKAFEHHDLNNFEKYIDVKSIIDSLIDQLIEINTEKEQPKNEWQLLGEALGRGLISVLKPKIIKSARLQIAKFIETGKLENGKQGNKSDEMNFSILGIWKKAGGEKISFQGIKYIKKEGDTAYVGLKFYHKEYNTNLILELKMKDKGGYWQVVELSNFVNYMRKLDELETKRINELNKPIIKKLNKILTIEKIEKSSRRSGWGGIDKKIIFTIIVRNNSKKAIDTYKILLICKTLDGKELKRVTIVRDGYVGPGEIDIKSWTINVNMFLTDDNLLFDTPQSNLEISPVIQYIKFSDGSVIKLYKKEE